MIRQVMPEFHSKDHVIIPCDSWDTKHNLLSIVDEYPNLDLIGNARIDSVMYDLAPAQTGRRGRPAKHGKRLSVETDFTFSNEKIGDYYTGVRRVLTKIFSNREVLAYVTATENSEYRTKSVQEFRFELSQGIRSQIFFATFVKNIETHIKSNAMTKALK